MLSEFSKINSIMKKLYFSSNSKGPKIFDNRKSFYKALKVDLTIFKFDFRNNDILKNNYENLS